MAPNESLAEVYRSLWEHTQYRVYSPGMDYIEVALEALKPNLGASFIDFGCGTGRPASELRKRGYGVVGVDFADNCLDEGIDIPFVVADLTKAISVTAEYGLCTDVLEHIEPDQIDNVLMNICCAVKKGVFFSIALMPDEFGPLYGKKPLHLTLKDGPWWMAKLAQIWPRVELIEETWAAITFACFTWPPRFREDVKIEALCNTPDDVIRQNIRLNGQRGLPWVALGERDNAAVIVGGGPSLSNTLNFVKAFADAGATVFALNNAANYLNDRGIVPDWQIIIDSRPENIRFLKDFPAKGYILSAQCHPSLFDYLEGKNVLIFYPALGLDGMTANKQDAVRDLLPKETLAAPLIVGMITSGLQALSIAHVMGFRQLHLHGYDSSDSDDGEAHAYPQNLSTAEKKRLRAKFAGREFSCSFAMYRQAEEFPRFSKMLADAGSEIHVYGDGLLPTVAHKMLEEPEPDRLLTVYWDYGTCPPSYDILTVLANAEQYRKENGYGGLKVVFVPGPADGFRDDNMPPTDLEHRKQMFWGVNMGLCRCLPSVKSIGMAAYGEVSFDKDCFPVDYSPENREIKYGLLYLLKGMIQNDLAFFRAPQWSVDHVRKWIKPNTVTITLREAHYVTDRNSALDEWPGAAFALRNRGFNVVVIRDTENAYNSDWYGFDVCHAASLDMAYRLALYECASINLFSANGPFTLALVDPKVRGIVFGLERHGGIDKLTAADWARKQFPVGSQWPYTEHRFRISWPVETVETIVKETLDFAKRPYRACYDLAQLPANWDAVTWLVIAEMNRRRVAPMAPLQVAFKAGPNGGFRNDNLPHAPETRKYYLGNIAKPLLPLIGASENINGHGYGADRHYYLMNEVCARAGEGVPLLAPSDDDRAEVRQWIDKNSVATNPLVITLREASHWPERNSDLAVWTKFARKCGHDVVFVRDTEKAYEPIEGFKTCPHASYDVGFRLALYELALCNLTVPHGPAMLLFFSKASYLLFRPLIDPTDAGGWPAGTPEWWTEKVGVEPGQQFPWAKFNQRIVWDNESVDVLLREWNEMNLVLS